MTTRAFSLNVTRWEVSSISHAEIACVSVPRSVVQSRFTTTLSLRNMGSLCVITRQRVPYIITRTSFPAVTRPRLQIMHHGFGTWHDTASATVTASYAEWEHLPRHISIFIASIQINLWQDHTPSYVRSLKKYVLIKPQVNMVFVACPHIQSAFKQTHINEFCKPCNPG